MSLAKNIKLAEGTIGVWEECLIEDIKSGIMDFEDFIIATKKIIREPLFNRIDYADIYTLAVEIAKNKTLRQNPSPVCLYNSIPEEVKEMAKKLGSRLATSCGETLGKGKNEKNI